MSGNINNEDEKRYMLVSKALQTECLVKTCCSVGAQQNHPNLLRGIKDSLRVKAKKRDGPQIIEGISEDLTDQRPALVGP